MTRCLGGNFQGRTFIPGLLWMSRPLCAFLAGYGYAVHLPERTSSVEMNGEPILSLIQEPCAVFKCEYDCNDSELRSDAGALKRETAKSTVDTVN